MANPDRVIRPPPLANEIIMTHKEEVKVVEEQPKRLKMKDAGIQKNEDKPSSIKGV